MSSEIAEKTKPSLQSDYSIFQADLSTATTLSSQTQQLINLIANQPNSLAAESIEVTDQQEHQILLLLPTVILNTSTTDFCLVPIESWSWWGKL